jgi:hypothetical protein
MTTFKLKLKTEVKHGSESKGLFRHKFSSVQCVVLKYFGEVALPTVLCDVEDWLLVHTPVATTYTSQLSQA